MFKGNAFEGFETFINAFKMAVKMHGYILLFAVLAHLLLFFSALNLKKYDAVLLANWVKIHFFVNDQPVKFPLPNGKFIVAPAAEIKTIRELKDYLETSLRYYVVRLKKTAVVYLAYPLLLLFFYCRSAAQSVSEHIRGAHITTAWMYKKRMRANQESPGLPMGFAPMPLLKRPLPFAQVRMPKASESQHLIIVGKSGCGKTTAINAMIRELRMRGERLVIYDSKGDFIAKFYDPAKDYIWNPVDARSIKWTIFNDMTYLTDIYSYANSQIPPDNGKHAFWSNAARDIFIAMLKYLYREGKTSNKDVWEMIIAEDRVIGKLLQKDGHLAAKYLSNPRSDSAKASMSSLVNFLQSYEFMAENDGDFSISQWVEKGSGAIFISSLSHLRDSLKPLISIFLDTLSKRLLSLKDYPDQKTFFILEELWTLQRLPSLLDLITQSRSKGGAVILSVQEIAQLDTIYGSANRKTIFNNCSNKLIMGTAESETAEYLSNLIGEQEIIESGKSYNLGIDNFKDGINISRHKKVRKVLLPSEIKDLKNLHGLVQISGYPPFPVAFKYRQNQYPDQHAAVVIRESNKLKNLLRAAEV